MLSTIQDRSCYQRPRAAMNVPILVFLGSSVAVFAMVAAGARHRRRSTS
jgi:hypothetical protein